MNSPGLGGSGSFQLTLVRHDVVKTRTPCISSHEITCDASALRAAKGQRGVNRGVSTVWKVEGGQWWFHESGHAVGGLTP